MQSILSPNEIPWNSSYEYKISTDKGRYIFEILILLTKLQQV